jgi:AbrB family looped-hinge helix DNA binding protein
MQTITLSPAFQLEIPESICQELGISPGQKLELYVSDGALHIRPVRTVSHLRGAAKGISRRDDYRDRNDRY